MKFVLIMAMSLLASGAYADDLNFGGFGFLKGSAGIGGVVGGSRDISGSEGFANTNKWGNSSADAKQEGYGQSESTFKGGWNANGGSEHGNSDWKAKGSTLSGSGSLSQVQLSSGGGGNASASAGGGSFGAGLSGGLGGGLSLGGKLEGSGHN